MNQRMTREERQAADAVVSDQLRRIKQHQASGRFEAAGKLIDEMLEDHRGNTRLTHYKGMNLIFMGERAKGRELIEAALAEAPEDPIQLCDFGAYLAQNGEMETAKEQFRTAVEVAPNYSLARSNLGAALVLEENFAEAIPHLEKAIELDHQLMDAHTNLANAYMQTHRFDQAINTLFKALAIDPQAVGVHIALAAALLRRERYESAEHHARRALELNPNAVEARLHLGNAMASSGRMDEAAEALLSVARGPVRALQAVSRLIHLRKTTADSPEFQLLQRAIERLGDLNDEQRATVHYAAGKAYDDLNDYAAAFDHFRKANEINRKIHEFDAEAYAERGERLIAFASPALMTRCGGEGVNDAAPVFICGMPRSGTTLMDQMFSRHPRVQAGGELPSVPMALQRNTRLRLALEEKLPDDEITADDFNCLGEDYLSSVRKEGIRSEHFTDKMPSNFLYIGMLALALPRAKFLIMRRHPLDCLLSNYMQHFGRNQPFSADFEHMAVVYGVFDAFARHWPARLPDRVRTVSYEAVTQDPEDRMREVLDFVGLDWDDRVLDHESSLRQVNTASLAQVREPIYFRAVERWRRYGPLLDPMASELRAFLTSEELTACGVKPAH